MRCPECQRWRKLLFIQETNETEMNLIWKMQRRKEKTYEILENEKLRGSKEWKEQENQKQKEMLIETFQRRLLQVRRNHLQKNQCLTKDFLINLLDLTKDLEKKMIMSSMISLFLQIEQLQTYTMLQKKLMMTKDLLKNKQGKHLQNLKCLDRQI